MSDPLPALSVLPRLIISFAVLAGMPGGVSAATSASTPDEWTIVVETTPFPSAEAAATGEASVSWQDRDGPEAIACTLGYAAVELRDHLQKIVANASEASFPLRSAAKPQAENTLRLVVWDPDKSDPAIANLLSEEQATNLRRARGAFAIVPHKTSLFIIGADRTGTLYGTYAFLESLGVRWYGPEAHEIYLPKISALTIPEEPILSVPSFAMRGFWVREDKGNLDFYRWMARNRMNFWSIAEPNRAVLHKLGMHLTFGGHHYWEKYMAADAPYPFDHVGFEGDESLPPDPYAPPSAAFRGDLDGDGRLTFFEARPEWYGLDEEGVRTPFEGMYGMNVCTSNPDPLHYIYSRIVDELAHGEWQDVDSLNFWSIDNGVWCQCTSCAALGAPTDRLLLMVHGLDQAVDQALARGELQRGIKIVFPIYQQTVPPPTRPLPADFDYTTNIGTFFPILRCYVHSIDDPTCTEFNRDFWQAFQGWTGPAERFYRGEIFVGEYFNVSVNKSLPVIYPRIIQTDLPKYHAAGARHMHYMHTDTRLLGVKRINNFLFARKLWEVTSDLAPEIDLYFKNNYGPVATEMRAVYRELEFALSNIRQMRYWEQLPDRIREGLFPLFPKAHFQLEKSIPERDDGVDLAESVAAFHRLRPILNEILQRDLPDRIRQRLAIDDQTIRYGENTVFFYDAVARAVMAEHEGDLARARAEFARSLPFARALKAETEVVQTATNHHVHAKDGLDATRIEEAYMELGQRLLPDFRF
jgi:hypothetical protein